MGIDKIMVGPDGLHDPAEKARLFEEAMSVAPADYSLHSQEEMLPSHPWTGRCRLCGATKRLSKEHIPPKKAGNVATAPAHTLTEWLEREGLESVPGGRIKQGGIWGYTLCRDCNSYTGREYGTEYRDWAIRAVLLMRQGDHPAILNENPIPTCATGILGGPEDGGLRPGRMFRQVLSGMCSLSGEWDLAAWAPAVRRIVLEGSQEPLPSGMSLSMELFAGPSSRMSGPQLVMSDGRWEWVMEIAHPPFAFLLVLAANGVYAHGMEMNQWAEMDLDRRVTLEATWQVGFCWTPLPGDYRTRAAIEQARRPGEA